MEVPSADNLTTQQLRHLRIDLNHTLHRHTPVVVLLPAAISYFYRIEVLALVAKRKASYPA